MTGHIHWLPIDDFQKFSLGKLFLSLTKLTDNSLSNDQKQEYKAQGPQIISGIKEKYPGSAWAKEAEKELADKSN